MSAGEQESASEFDFLEWVRAIEALRQEIYKNNPLPIDAIEILREIREGEPYSDES